MSEDIRELTRCYAEACARAHACQKTNGSIPPQIRSAITRAFNRVWAVVMKERLSEIEFGEMLREEQRRAQSQ